MPKRLLIAAASLMLAVFLILLLPVTLADPGMASRPTVPPVTVPSTGTTTPSTPEPTAAPTTPTWLPSSSLPTIPTTRPTVPTEPATQPPTQPTTQPPTTTTTAPPPPGQVRLYICDKTMLEIYAFLAVEYYAATGTEVILLTNGEDESCEEGLARYMASDAPPTMFCVHREETLETYADSLYNLTGTQAARQLYNPDFGMYHGEKLAALPVAVDWFGYIYNASLLKDAAFTRADFYRSDMTGYNSMAYIAKYLTSMKTYPFGKPNFSATSDQGLASLLSTALSDPEQIRSFIDLYVGNSRSTVNALTSFQNELIVFYAGTTATFEEVLGLGIDKLDLLPAFVKGSNAMRYTCNDFWAVTGVGYGPDIQETLTFLGWMVTEGSNGRVPIDSLGLLSPYQDATVVRNSLEKLLRQYMAQEPVCLVWDNSCVEQADFDAFCQALADYYAKPNDTTWEKVEKLMKKAKAAG